MLNWKRIYAFLVLANQVFGSSYQFACSRVQSGGQLEHHSNSWLTLAAFKQAYIDPLDSCSKCDLLLR